MVALSLAAPVSAGEGDRPIEGTMTGPVCFTDAPECPVGLLTETHAAGVVTRLGRAEITMVHCTPVGADIAGEMVLTAANGDIMLYGEYAGTCVVDTPDLVEGETQFICDTQTCGVRACRGPAPQPTEDGD